MGSSKWRRGLHPLFNAGRSSYVQNCNFAATHLSAALYLANVGRQLHCNGQSVREQSSLTNSALGGMLNLESGSGVTLKHATIERRQTTGSHCRIVLEEREASAQGFDARFGYTRSHHSAGSVLLKENINVIASHRRGCHETQVHKASALAYKGAAAKAFSSQSKKDDPIVGEHVHPEKEQVHWLQAVLPGRLWPVAQLARLDKPVGTWLLLWPCYWSIGLAAPSGSLPDLQMLALFGTGAFLLRGAGCTINDMLDRDIDSQVERTKGRPLAAGVITPLEALAFLGAQLSLGLIILLQLNAFSQILGASSLLLVGSYPLMKRYTFWPQAYLGLAFNWGALLGWAAVTGDLNPHVVIPLYAAGISWTLVYDTIYAHQDKVDDAKVGVKSTALRFGDNTRMWLTGFGSATIANLALAGTAAGIGGWPYSAALAAAGSHLAWQVAFVDIHNRTDCHHKFVSNKFFGALVFSGIVLGKLSARKHEDEASQKMTLAIDDCSE